VVDLGFFSEEEEEEKEEEDHFVGGWVLFIEISVVISTNM
jgi:hypothetical protein